MDLFSRMIVHLEIHPCESAELASQMIIARCTKQEIKRWQIAQDAEILAKRHTVYEEAKLKHPNRWAKATRDWSRVDVVELNPERTTEVNKVSSCSQAS